MGAGVGLSDWEDWDDDWDDWDILGKGRIGLDSWDDYDDGWLRKWFGGGGGMGGGGLAFGVIGGGGCMFGMIWMGDGWDDWNMIGNCGAIGASWQDDGDA